MQKTVLTALSATADLHLPARATDGMNVTMGNSDIENLSW